jgi:hypothetical protein
MKQVSAEKAPGVFTKSPRLDISELPGVTRGELFSSAIVIKIKVAATYISTSRKKGNQPRLSQFGENHQAVGKESGQTAHVERAGTTPCGNG